MKKTQIEVPLSNDSKVVFSDEKNSHFVKVEMFNNENQLVDYIYINHNARISLIKWLVNSII